MVLQALTGGSYPVASANGRAVSDLLAAFGAEVNPFAPLHDDIPALLTTLIGNNDIGQDLSAATIYASITALAEQRAGHGFYNVIMTVPRNAFWLPGSDRENVRLALNALILANAAGFDAAYDLSSILTDPDMQTTDGTHFTVAFNITVANALNVFIRSQFGW